MCSTCLRFVFPPPCVCFKFHVLLTFCATSSSSPVADVPPFPVCYLCCQPDFSRPSGRPPFWFQIWYGSVFSWLNSSAADLLLKLVLIPFPTHSIIKETFDFTWAFDAAEFFFWSWAYYMLSFNQLNIFLVFNVLPADALHSLTVFSGEQMTY